MASNGSIICGPLPASDDTTPDPTTSCCLDGGLWSDWGEWTACQGTCNQCGSTQRTRTCLSAASNCPCDGDATESKECKVTGVWNDWVIQQQCNDTCGACGVAIYSRTCKSTDCACVGQKTKTEACAFTPCIYPKDSCCGSYKAGAYQGQILCGPLVKNLLF